MPGSSSSTLPNIYANRAYYNRAQFLALKGNNIKKPDISKFTIKQTWMQKGVLITEERPYYVASPSSPQSALLYLHGNGGSASNAIENIADIFPTHLVIAPQGYEKSWNVTTEKSTAPDVQFIEEIIKTYIIPKNLLVTIVGESNGAAMAHRIMIESNITQIRGAVCVVSQLASVQYQNDTFRKQGGRDPPNYDPKYNISVVPVSGRKLVMLLGANDTIVTNEISSTPPYTSPAGEMLSIKDSAFAWATVLVNPPPPVALDLSITSDGYSVQYGNIVLGLAINNVKHTVPLNYISQGVNYVELNINN